MRLRAEPLTTALRRERVLLAAILILALAVRVVWILQMRSSPYFDDPAVDQKFYVEAGRAVASAHELRPGPIVRPPLYSWWLGLIFGLFGPGLLLPRILQAFLGTATVWLVHRVGKLAFDARTGLLAAFFAATYWVLVYYDGELLRESLANPLNLLGVLGTLQLSRRPSWSRGIGAGLAWGLSALLRPQVLAFVPFLALWLLFHARTRIRWVIVFVAAVAVPILPVTTYNAVVGHDSILVSAEGGQALWIGNNPQADGVTPVIPGMRVDFWGLVDDARGLAEFEEGRSLRPSEVSHHYVEKTLTWFRERPAAAAKLLLRKLWIFCTDWEFGNPEEPRFFAERFAPIVRWLPLGFGVALSLAVLGALVRSRQGAASRFPIWGFVLVYGATVVLFFVSARYREPVIPLLLIYSACGALVLVDAALARAWKQLATALAGCALVYAGSHSFPVQKDASTANGLCWLAAAEGRAGRTEEATRLFEEAIERNPSSCEGYRGLGVGLLLAGRTREGVHAFEKAVELCPQDVYALDMLAELHLKAGEPAEAVPLAESSIRAAPHLHRGYYNLGRADFEQGRLPEAADAFRLSLARKPDDFNAAYMLGTVSSSLGRDEDARLALVTAVAQGRDADGEFLFQAYRALIDVLVRSDQREEARRHAEEFVRRFPDRPEAREILGRL